MKNVKEFKVFQRFNLALENAAAIKRGETRTLDPAAIVALPDARFPIYLDYPLDKKTRRCSICLSESVLGVLDVDEKVFQNLPVLRVDFPQEVVE